MSYLTSIIPVFPASESRPVDEEDVGTRVSGGEAVPDAERDAAAVRVLYFEGDLMKHL